MLSGIHTSSPSPNDLDANEHVEPTRHNHDTKLTPILTKRPLACPLATAGPQGRHGGRKAGSRPPSVQDLQGGGVQIRANSLLGGLVPQRTVVVCDFFASDSRDPKIWGCPPLFAGPQKIESQFFWCVAGFSRQGRKPAAPGSVSGRIVLERTMARAVGVEAVVP